MAEHEPIDPFAELGLGSAWRDDLSRPSLRRPSSVLVYGVGWDVTSSQGWRGVLVRVGRWLTRLGGAFW
jgi:hypothetical protein